VLSVNGYRLEVDCSGPSTRLVDVLRSETKFKVRAACMHAPACMHGMAWTWHRALQSPFCQTYHIAPCHISKKVGEPSMKL